MTDTQKPERLQIILTQEELMALDDWRYTNRMPTRAAAVRELMRRGMEVRIDERGGLAFKRSRDVRLVKHAPNNGNGAKLFG